MVHVVVVGGGISGCGAALTARKCGAEVTLIEKIDTLISGAKRAGEHSGKVGVADCLSSGLLSGHNAVRTAEGKEPLVLSRKLIIGESIAYFSDGTRNGDTLQGRFGNMGQGPFFEHIKQLGLYSEDAEIIHQRVSDAGLKGVFSEKIA